MGVLEAAGLIEREVQGREHWLSIRPDGLALAERWLGEQTAFWAQRADALAARIERTHFAALPCPAHIPGRRRGSRPWRGLQSET